MSRTDFAAWVVATVGLVLCVVLAVRLNSSDAALLTIVSAVGSLASFIGLLVVAIQLIGVRKAASAAVGAATETRDSIRMLLALADVSKTIKLIEQVQNDVGAARYEVARVRLQDVRANLVHFQPSIARLGQHEAQRFDELLSNISIDLTNLYNASQAKGKPLNAARFSKGLEELIALLLKAERHFKLQG
jgi:hypothetical protein